VSESICRSVVAGLGWCKVLEVWRGGVSGVESQLQTFHQWTCQEHLTCTWAQPTAPGHRALLSLCRRRYCHAALLTCSLLLQIEHRLSGGVLAWLICLQRGADLHMAQLMPLPLTVSCLSQIQIGFTFLVPAHLGSPGQTAIKRVCVCATDVVWSVCLSVSLSVGHNHELNQSRCHLRCGLGCAQGTVY